MKMAERNDNSNYRIVHDAVLRMHQLFREGKRKSEEVSAIRDATDEPWNELSDEKRKTIQGLSQDLYEMQGATRKTPVAASTLELERKVSEAVQAKEEGQLDRALELLRECQGYSLAYRVSYLRGSIWLLKKDPKIAIVFFKHALDQDPGNEVVRSAWLNCLKTAYPEAEMVEAEKKRKSTVN
jgi:hypothetical protein